MSPPTETQLDRFVRDGRDGLRAAMRRSQAEPSFEDMLARVPGTAPREPGGTGQPEPPVLAIDGARQRRASATHPELDAFVADARAGVHAQLLQRQRGEVPPMRAEHHRGGRLRLGLLVVGAAAAVLLGALAWMPGALAERDDTGIGGAQAARAIHDTDAEPLEAAQSSRDEDTSARRRRRPTHGEAADAPAPAVNPTPAPQQPTSLMPAPIHAPRQSLEELAAQAQAHWKAGDLAGARRRLEAIIARGAKSRAAELAYGDLFALARQQRGTGARLGKLWRGYLRRFPRGRFADDARAGLCRVAASGARTDCWARYLADFEHGSYRSEAARQAGSEVARSP